MELTETQKGYKHTKLGWIPEDWEIAEVGTKIKLSKVKHNPKVSNKALKCIELENIEKATGNINGYFDSRQQKSIKNKFEVGDTLFGKLRPNLRKFWIANFEGVCSTEIWVLKSINEQLIKDFLFYFVQQEKFYQISTVTSGSKMPRANWNYISNYPMLFPSKKDQKSIAQCLNTWDTAITKLSKLIKVKQKLKKGLMQQLLTGKKRLPGFDGEWKKSRLGDVTNFFSRRNKTLIDARIYSVTNSNGFIYQSDHFSREVAGDDLASYKIIKRNEFAYNPARINVGSIAFFEDEVGVISSLYVCFSTNDKMTDDYMRYLIQLEKTQFDFNRYGEGGVRIYLWYPLFASIKVEVPPITEQKAISNVLLAADKEIQLLQEQLKQMELQKKGMVQQLLTGKKRLKD